MQNFREWLSQQVNRQDPIGDLARDVRDDSSLNDSVTTPEELKEHVECTSGSCYKAVEACVAAGDEYSALHKL